MVLILTGQALEGPKLLDAQHKPGQLIVFDTHWRDTDAKLTIKGRSGPTKTTLSNKEYLIADPRAKQRFYTVGEILFSKEALKAKRIAKTSMTLLSIQIDINGGVISCDVLLIEPPKTPQLLDNIKRSTMEEIANCTEYTVIEKQYLAGSLDLHEIRDTGSV
jgi:hypothetical protein